MYRRVVKCAFVLVLFCAALFSPYGEAAIKEKNTITVDADNVVGEIYNLWDVRVLNAPEKWEKEGYAEKIKSSSKHISTIMNVRALGGKKNHTCDWFKGVDAKGEPVCDYTGLYKIMDAQIGAGFTPWIVLDQVPHAMTSAEPGEEYGIINAADDMNLWYKYVKKTVQVMVDKYGMETVSKWHFRVGTEPDNGRHWAETREKYFEHYDYTVAAVESVIPEPLIGPGNFLMHRGVQSAKKTEPWTFDILEHCANGKNCYTGKTGTRITFYCQSCYAISGQPFPYEANMKKYREALAQYPSLQGLDHEIHEYGELRSIQRKGAVVGAIEWFVGLYAQTVDIAYRYGTRRIFNWGGHGGPRGHVVNCLAKMKGGRRVEVIKDEEKKLSFGAIAAWKGKILYALVYSHDPKVNGNSMNDIDLTIKGNRISKTKSWSLDEYLFDKDNGVCVREMYKDIEAAGIMPKEGAREIESIHRKYPKKNKQKVNAILEKNSKKYQALSEMKQVRSGERIELKNGTLDLNLQLKGSGFRFIKLTPKLRN